MDKSEWVASLTESVALTPLDYTAPQGYIPIIFGFNFDGSPLDAAAYLKVRLARTLAKWPCLGGQFIAGGSGVSPKLIYSSTGPTSLEAFPNEVFDFRGLQTDQLRWDEFDQLVREHGPAEAMDKDILCLLPEKLPGPGEGCHPVTLRVNFTKDRKGILLGLSLHHGIHDGTGVRDFLACFAGLDAPNPEADSSYFSRFLEQKKTIDWFIGTWESREVNMNATEDYNFNEPSQPPLVDPTAPPGIARIISIPADRIAKLHELVLDMVKEKHGSSAFVSTADTVSALLWVYITRARRAHLLPHEISHFATAVDIRSKIPLLTDTPESYLGNAFLRVTTKSLAVLLAPDEHDNSPIAIARCVAYAAHLIRKAIQTLDSPSHLRHHLSIAVNTANPPDVDAAVRRVIDRGHAGVDCSSWLALGADLNFHIPGTEHKNGGKPVFIRRAYAPFPGAMNIMPRRGGTKGDADWEIWVALRGDDMERLVRGLREGGGAFGRVRQDFDVMLWGD
ncbi:hypothetical protein B0T14DRAFT_498792 [Immersiella caudata]|uniref:Trichothecene 3-O-acetyltransferase n=1 Tax=Immersiella caudata TaxID=314043 RepID=A0AA40BTN6_9PEZI|nr:hypothetical protein B0T14DRAFT_498792 [Immersiella caudata]